MINIATRLSPLPNYDVLGDLALSVLRGVHGNQRRAFQQLVDWLNAHFQAEILTLTNVLLSAPAPAAKERLRVPILAYLQGDDVFSTRSSRNTADKPSRSSERMPRALTVSSPRAAITPTTWPVTWALIAIRLP